MENRKMVEQCMVCACPMCTYDCGVKIENKTSRTGLIWEQCESSMNEPKNMALLWNKKKQQSADGQSYKSTEIYKGGLRIYF